MLFLFTDTLVTIIFIQVERGLWLFTCSEDALKGVQDGSALPLSTSHGLGFTENPWGMKAREYVMSTEKLKDTHWSDITNDISDLKLLCHDSQEMEVDSEDDGNGNITGTQRMNPHVCIDIDW